MNKKLIYLISGLITIILVVGTILLVHNYKLARQKEIIETYGVVKHVYADSIVVEEANTNKEVTFIKDGESDIKEGDLIVVKTQDNKIKSHQVIVDNYDDITTTTITTTTPTTTTIIVDTTTTTPTVKTTTSKATTTSTTTKVVDKDKMIVDYLNQENENIKNGDNSLSLKDRAKNVFTSVVDFIFYDGTIKGVKFSELKDTTKSKVIYYALLIDSGIESKFPKYKENIGAKYNDIKAKLIAEFLDLKYKVCSKSSDACEQAKEDLAILKKALNLTWDTVKSVFGYIKDLSVPKIKSWYESFRG